MIFELLNVLAQISGLTTFIALLVAFAIGFTILYKALKNKERILYLFSLCVFFTTSPWWPMAFSYIFWVITTNTIPYQIFIIIGTFGIPIAIFSWLDIYFNLIFPQYKKIVMRLYALLTIAFVLYVIFFAFLAPGAPIEPLLGSFDSNNPIKLNSKGFVSIYRLISVLLAIITGVHFSIKSMEVRNNPNMVWKGRFLLIAFLLFTYCAVFDAIVPMNALLLVINRCLLALTAFFFFLGFLLPNWIKRILGIDEEIEK